MVYLGAMAPALAPADATKVRPDLAAFIEEAARKREAYEAKRRAYTAAWRESEAKRPPHVE